MKYTVCVKPGSKKGPLINREATGELAVYLREKAIDGGANAALISLLSKEYKVAKTNINIISGQKSRRKVVEVLE
jgi:uncharacterized protein YggU (UPF0235/DUF167 family)